MKCQSTQEDMVRTRPIIRPEKSGGKIAKKYCNCFQTDKIWTQNSPVTSTCYQSSFFFLKEKKKYLQFRKYCATWCTLPLGRCPQWQPLPPPWRCGRCCGCPPPCGASVLDAGYDLAPWSSVSLGSSSEPVGSNRCVACEQTQERQGPNKTAWRCRADSRSGIVIPCNVS